ncbi:LysM peptidoglycan-binding domain-containing M23 family metallopeptidase [Streptomyces sp. L2]|uniref:M23 family metallopeptidase n=1 Tax=Streptomyces sp. L2 TaxID=2162665 RepID=UPI0010123974|nr:LysM peptidoglycan-binding domain-containing M23 family metallopeptidase [Streptomyces sp. L2]
MPAKGKHRRPKTQRLTRSIAVAGTGGAALALPLVGAAGAHAATPQSGSAHVTQALPAAKGTAVKATAAKPAAAHRAPGVRTYTVKSGDCLAKIADDHDVRGGWHRLYDDNRQAVGDDPSLIHPGLKLTLGKRAAAAHHPSSDAHSATPSTHPSKPQTPPPAATPSTGFTLPVTGATIGTGYHVAGSMWSSGYHTGVDFVVPTGTSVKSVAAGTVVSAGWGGAYGNQVVVKLNDGHYAQYAHLSQLSVSAGQSVTEGQQLGLSGATGNVTGPHLHFEIRTTPDYGSDIDPVAYLSRHGVTVG